MYSVPDSKTHIQEFEPARVKPVYTYITKKYLCEEDVVQTDVFTPPDISTLTFNIKESDPSMVWKSVRLCFPLEVGAWGDNRKLSLRIADNEPSCNVAFAASAYEVFSDMQLIVNGSMFSTSPNRYQGMLDRVYRGRDVLSFQSGGSLKPIVNRNLKKSTEANAIFAVQDDDDEKGGSYVQIHDTYSSVSRNAFDLTQSNAGFVTRAAHFQQGLSGSNRVHKSILSMYMDIGIFQNKERKLPGGRRLYNDACPYLRDVTIRCTFDQLRSNFDSKYHQNLTEAMNFFNNRDMPSKLLEFATPVNSAIFGEPALPVSNWVKYFSCLFRAKPYLEVQFVMVPEQQLKPQYSLMALRHQHEVSDLWNFEFTGFTDDFGQWIKPTVTQRINSRLLEVASKIYIWAGLSFNDKKSWFLGNTGNQRFCEISRLHLRMNTRPDALFEPTQLECYNIFKRLTTNDMNYQTWNLSPIYCFDPQALGQPEFLASDGQLMTYDFTCDVTPTDLQYSEMLFLQNGINLRAMGYDQDWAFQDYFMVTNYRNSVTRIRKYVNWIPNRYYSVQAGPNPWGSNQLLVPDCQNRIHYTTRRCTFAYYIDRNFGLYDSQAAQTSLAIDNDPTVSPPIWKKLTEGMFLKKQDGQIAGNNQVENEPEIWRIHSTLETRVRFDGLIWAIWDADNEEIVQPHAQACLWYVPESWPMTMVLEDYGRLDNGQFMHKAVMNSLDDLVMNANGEIQFIGGKVPQDADDATAWGIIKGTVSMSNIRGEVVSRQFNKLTANAQASGFCPGPRGYPLAFAGAGNQRIIAGIRNIGMNDGGDPNGQVNNILRSGLAPENWPYTAAGQAGQPPAVEHRNFFKMINPVNVADNRAFPQRDYYWIAFQPTYLARTHANAQSRKVAWNLHPITQAQNFQGIDAGVSECGSISSTMTMTPNADVNAADGYIDTPNEVHIVKQVIERNVSNTQPLAGHAWEYYTLRDNDQGAIFQSTGAAANDQSITDSLDWSLNVLYEFGNDRYIVSKNGQLVQDNDTWTPTVIQKRSRVSAERLELPEKIAQDPRLSRGRPRLERVQEPRASGFHSHY